MRVRFFALDLGMYNLSFGVWKAALEEMDDLIETRNGDMEKILATVALTVEEFLSKNKRATIIASGSSRARTRKYQMGIARNIQQISDLYHVSEFIAEQDEQGNVVGQYSTWPGRWSRFQKGVNYDAFLIYMR